MNKREFLKEVRATAKANGFTLKEHTHIRINGAKAYYLIDRKTKRIIIENCTLNSAYHDAMRL